MSNTIDFEQQDKEYIANTYGRFNVCFEKGTDEDEEYYRRRNDFHITDGKGDDEKISDFIFGGDDKGEAPENDDYTNDVLDDGLLDDTDYDDED